MTKSILPMTPASLFRDVWPEHTAKRVAQAADSPLGTAVAWVRGRFQPSAQTLLTMADRNPAFRAELQRALAAMDARQDQSAALSAASRRADEELRAAVDDAAARRAAVRGGLVAPAGEVGRAVGSAVVVTSGAVRAVRR